MKHNLEFETGETTCAVEPGKFCQFYCTRNLGSVAWCSLFSELINDKDGWLQRTDNCINEFPNET